METNAALTRADVHLAPTSPIRQTPPEPYVAVAATYLLSEVGRKVSLLAGGDGRAQQQISIEMPASRMHLVTVDAQGVARLKLRPRYYIGEQKKIVRLDAFPSYDALPSLDELLKEAARNHQLESAFRAEREVARTERRDRDRELRRQVAESFLSDPSRRAIPHPPPTEAFCFVSDDTGRRIAFNAEADELPARDVPKEAHRRFRADLRARKEQNRQLRATQLGVHEDKKRWIGDWVAAHGSPDQQARQQAGLLPMDEAVDALADDALAAAAECARYTHDGVARLEAHLKQFPQYAGLTLTAADIVVTNANAARATAGQWTLMQALQKALPAATVTLRLHRLALKQDARAPALTLLGILVTLKVGPFALRREYAVPE